MGAFLASMKAATSHMPMANTFWRRAAGSRWRSALPPSMPARPPARKAAASGHGHTVPWERAAVTPDKEMRKMTSREVAMARCRLMPVTYSRAGTMMKPPPTPKRPESMPAALPAASRRK